MTSYDHSPGFLERVIESEASAYGFAVQDYDVARSGRDMFAGNRLVRRVPYTTIYGTQSVSTVLLSAELLMTVRVECFWQQASGSVYQKLPYIFFNARDKMPEENVILLVDGGGFPYEAIRWLKRECFKVETKNMDVFNIPEFRKWVKKFAQSDRSIACKPVGYGARLI